MLQGCQVNQEKSQDSSSEQGIYISQDGDGPGIWIIPWDYKELNELEY